MWGIGFKTADTIAASVGIARDSPELVKAIPPGAHLLLVGDVDQLPSVGAGEVLRDLLAAGSLPVVRLTKIFRQAQQSGIVVNAHRINAGEQPLLREFGDFSLFPCNEAEDTAPLVVDIVARRIPAKSGLNPRRDVQVLCRCAERRYRKLYCGMHRCMYPSAPRCGNSATSGESCCQLVTIRVSLHNKFIILIEDSKKEVSTIIRGR